MDRAPDYKNKWIYRSLTVPVFPVDMAQGLVDSRSAGSRLRQVTFDRPFSLAFERLNISIQHEPRFAFLPALLIMMNSLLLHLAAILARSSELSCFFLGLLSKSLAGECVFKLCE